MTYLGTIQFVQIQQESLKVDHDDTRHYDPSPLLTVARLNLTPDGVIGLTEAGDSIVDVHHTGHPRSRNRADNFVSMGFLSHYAHMRDRFGDHLTDGIAGENIIVANEGPDGTITPAMLGDSVRIETQDGMRIVLVDVLPTPPCEPFSRFAAGCNLAAPEMKTTLQFLSNGTRGFYMRLVEPLDEVMIQAGDRVFCG
ncbi:MAG: hypothetical protein CL610_25365 [Anaerolineaceae bacterium]|nr:hypothetical protein [Anaerolineaceae bacterium]